jgi:predicted nicotinamide N-methyase
MKKESEIRTEVHPTADKRVHSEALEGVGDRSPEALRATHGLSRVEKGAGLPPGYRTRPFELQLEGLPISLTLVENLDELLDELIAKGPAHEDVKDERIPYWAELWPAAMGLGRHLLRHGCIRPGMSVLELGCGLGLPGIVAGKCGAVPTFTDYLPDALAFARHNWEQNLDRPARFALLDWRDPDPAFAAEVVLASDIAYEKRAFPFLPQAFRTLCRPGGKVFVADPSRSSAPEFFDQLPAQGFDVDVFSYLEHYKGHPSRIQVYVLTPL